MRLFLRRHVYFYLNPFLKPLVSRCKKISNLKRSSDLTVLNFSLISSKPLKQLVRQERHGCHSELPSQRTDLTTSRSFTTTQTPPFFILSIRLDLNDKTTQLQLTNRAWRRGQKNFTLLSLSSLSPFNKIVVSS